MAEKTNKQEVKADISRYSKLEAVVNTEGGKDLKKALVKDIEAAIDELASKYKSAPDIELRATCAKLSERINLWRTLLRAPKNKKFAIKELELLEEEDPDIEPEL